MNRIWLSAGLLALLAAAWGVFAWWTHPRPLVMGTNAEFAPFEMLEEGEPERIVGFDVDLAGAIARKARRPLEIVDMDFEALIPALEAGTVDMVLVALTITPERAARVDFSEPYYQATQVVLMRAGEPAPAEKAELAGQPIGVQAGTTSHALAEELTDASKIRPAPTALRAVVDLINTQVDYVLIDEQPSEHFLRMYPALQRVHLEFDKELYGVAVRKGNAALLAVINETLADIAADGQYDWFVDRWMMQLD